MRLLSLSFAFAIACEDASHQIDSGVVMAPVTRGDAHVAAHAPDANDDAGHEAPLPGPPVDADDAVDAGDILAPPLTLPEPRPRVAPACSECGDGRRLLRKNWAMQSAFDVFASGATLSTPGFDASSWYPVEVPTTVLAALSANGVVEDPYYGDNIQRVSPLLPLPSWWFRTEFTVEEGFGKAVALALDGVNYRANVWLNGEQIATAADVIGTFVAFEWDVTSRLRVGEANALAIEVFAPDMLDDLTITWFDWNPAPPDSGTGIWQPVSLRPSGSVALRDVRVTSALSDAYTRAELTVEAELRNTTDAPIEATVRARIEEREVSRTITLAAGERRQVRFAPSEYPALLLEQPRLWWPAELGEPERYELDVAAIVGDSVSDREHLAFGIREVTATLTEDDHRQYAINGRPLLIRGAGFASDLLLRQDPERLEREFEYVRELGLNTLRLEGKLEADVFYDLADRYGILLLGGWMCCDKWQRWEAWDASDRAIGVASTATQARRMRNHPSVVDFLIGSDEAPPADVEREMLDALDSVGWPNPVCPSAAMRSTPALGLSGMKMNGPYDWIPPSYWSVDDTYGGAFGFSSEVGPGPAIPELEALRGMLTDAQQRALWTRLWDEHLHAGQNGGLVYNFGHLRLFNEAMVERLGTPSSLEDYVVKAQLLNYEAERAPFEAYARNEQASATGIIHWLLNSAWPSLIWNLYAHDLTPGGAYFGAKKANEPLHIMYAYDDHAIVVLNHTGEPAVGLEADVRVLDVDGTERLAHTTTVDAQPGAATPVVTLPASSNLSSTYFVALTLRQHGTPVSHNFYWLSTKPERIDFPNTIWIHSPTASFADFSALSSLPSVTLGAEAQSVNDGERGATRVTLTNDSPHVAFFTRLRLSRRGTGESVLPVHWDDNYVSLLPGETRTLQATYPLSALAGDELNVELSGVNQPRIRIAN